MRDLLSNRASWGSPWFNPETYELAESGGLAGLELILNRSTLRGGKRLRPLLMAEFGGLFGVDAEQIAPFARACEHVHSATLAHDDVIDASSTRRGIRTLNARVENRRAVLGGDYLLAEGIFAVAEQRSFPILASLSVALRELVTGELLQNEARGVVEISEEHLLRVADLKTASLFRWCCRVPAILGGADVALQERVSDFATRLGIAFQWIDDGLDYSTASGKPFGQDLREGLVNEVSRRLMENAPSTRNFVRNHFESGASEELPLPWSEDEVAVAVRETREKASVQLAGARRILKDIETELALLGRPVDPDALRRVEGILNQLERREK